MQTVQTAFPGAKPAGGLILGTGWSAAAACFKTRGVLAYRDIPGLGNTTVIGHTGQLVWGELAGREAFIFQGRRHWYEGVGWDPITIPVFLLKQFEAGFVVLTNSAGSLRAGMKPGALMVLDDHINAMNANPLIGPHDPALGERFPDQSHIYDPKLRTLLERSAARLGTPLAHGVYLGVSGPAYETPAEVRAFRAWGADAVGSSTVPEAILANAAGLRVAGLSCITNLAAGVGAKRLAHDDIHATAVNASTAMTALIREFWKETAACKKSTRGRSRRGQSDS
jgi:purine-nucleoside phosphorylase